MKNKLFNTINNELMKYVNGDKYYKLMRSKFAVQEYQEWLNSINGVEIDGLKLINESTGQNVCYTAFKTSVRENENMKIIDFFYIHKSLLGNFFSFYIKSKIVVKYSSGNIVYPNTLIVSPESNYSSFFQEAYNFVTNNYSDALIIPFFILKMKVNSNVNFFNKESPNYYQILFGYEGDILTDRLIGDTKYIFPH